MPPEKTKEPVLPPGPFYTVDRVTYLPPNMKPATKYGEGKKKPQPSESLVHFDGRLGGVGIFDGTFFYFFYDRQDWRR